MTKERFSIVGESGSGKSTFALAVSKLLPRNAIILEGGKISFRGKDLMELKKPQIRQVRGTGIFMIFQNVFLSLNPLMRIKRQVIEAIDVRSKRTGEKPEKKKAESEVTSILKSVRIGDAEDIMERYPHQLSGGQNQRIMLAMALAEKPSLLIADEPTTALDVTTQAQVILLLKEIRDETKMSIVYVTHDLGVAASISDRIAVLYGGMVQELGPAKQVLSDPKHPYTLALLSAIPDPDPSTRNANKSVIQGDVPSPINIPPGCRFRSRCPYATQKCADEFPPYVEVEPSHWIECHYDLNLDPGGMAQGKTELVPPP